MRPLIDHWSPLTHDSSCKTTSRPAAATQMRKCKPIHVLHGIFMLDALSATTFVIFGLGDWLRLCYAGLHTLRLGFTCCWRTWQSVSGCTVWTQHRLHRL